MIANAVACPGCDLLQGIPPLPQGGTARCPRCGRTVAANKAGFLDREMALSLAALIVFVVANVEPLMTLSVGGRESSTTILGGVKEMWLQGEWVASVLIGLFAFAAPALYIVSMLAVLSAARRPPAPRWVGTLLRWTKVSGLWSMIEVMLLGILVALVKIASIAKVEPGIGIFAAAAFIALMTSVSAGFDPAEVWSVVRWANGEGPPASPGSGPGGEVVGQAVAAASAARGGLVSCEACGLLVRPAAMEEPGFCPRCGAGLEFRRPDVVQRTWALVAAAAICYLPANILPVMTTNTIRHSEPDTILSGIVVLYKTGSWHLALIVLIASVMIPLAKLAALSYLLVTVQRGSPGGRRDRAKLYRLLEIVGRWSMLDVFVVTYTVALIRFRPLMSMTPGPG
ncbi:MAG: paraquat-inducible protein A, partial [Deltaproteobacteria bacterium]|nr:paraquat-inducible protein A [Deltaproteobacteria bacterium]